MPDEQKQSVADLNKGDARSLLAACAPHTAIVDGKAVTEEIEIDEADLEREIGEYAKAC